mgnify:CR=1 FL=1
MHINMEKDMRKDRAWSSIERPRGVRACLADAWRAYALQPGKYVGFLLAPLLAAGAAFAAAGYMAARLWADFVLPLRLLAEAVGRQLTCVFVDHGLMRKNEGDEVEAAFSKWDINFVRVDAEQRFLGKLAGVSEGATKTAASSTNGNVNIDGKEVVVYTEPENVLHDEDVEDFSAEEIAALLAD